MLKSTSSSRASIEAQHGCLLEVQHVKCPPFVSGLSDSSFPDACRKRENRVEETNQFCISKSSSSSQNTKKE